MELTKAKFKQTEVGLIPNDWSVVPMSEITTMMTNGFVGTAKTHYTESRNGITYIQGFNVEANSFNFTGIKKVTPEFHKKNKKSNLKEGDLLTVQTGDVGLTTIVPKELEGSNCHALIISRFNFSKAAPKYYTQYFNSIIGRARLVKLETGTTMKHINVGDLVHWLVPLPPTLEEQKAIATALSDVDELIRNLDKLIAKKKSIKQGAMQQLLTPPHKGGKRLPGFTGEWEEKEIRKIVSTPVTDGPHETPSFVKDGIPFLSVNNIINNKIDYSELRYISKNDDVIYSKKCKPKKYDILLGKAASVGKVALVDKDWDFNIWSPLALIRCKSKYLYSFVYYSFQTIEMQSQIDGLTNSSSQGNIGMGDIEQLKICFPKIFEEQKAISKILTDMDAEIESFEVKKAKYQSIKQGMMQQLLTGKTRLA